MVSCDAGGSLIQMTCCSVGKWSSLARGSMTSGTIEAKAATLLLLYLCKLEWLELYYEKDNLSGQCCSNCMPSRSHCRCLDTLQRHLRLVTLHGGLQLKHTHNTILVKALQHSLKLLHSLSSDPGMNTDPSSRARLDEWSRQRW